MHTIEELTVSSHVSSLKTLSVRRCLKSKEYDSHTNSVETLGCSFFWKICVMPSFEDKHVHVCHKY